MLVKKETLIIALGGNALVKKGQKGTFEEQLENLRIPIEQIAKLSSGYQIVITHGNGPQVGNLLLKQEHSGDVSKMPLEILVAETQGQIGYMIESTLDGALNKQGQSKKFFLTVLTYVKVDKADPAFQNPTKPIGPTYTKEEAKSLPYQTLETSKGYRRVVASPNPLKIYQHREIKKLLENDFIVIACGGGGIPVIREGDKVVGVEAVIDKDRASARLGKQIGADILLIATDVEKVALNFGKENQKDLDVLTTEEAKSYITEGHFAKGSMLPKIQACINFLEGGGKKAIITPINKISEALEGKAGTRIVKN